MNKNKNENDQSKEVSEQLESLNKLVATLQKEVKQIQGIRTIRKGLGLPLR